MHRHGRHVIVHTCGMPQASYSGLPTTSPRASCLVKILRQVRKLLIVSESHALTSEYFRSNACLQEERRRHVRKSRWYVIHPFSRFSLWYEFVMCLLWAVALAKDPYLTTFFGPYEELLHWNSILDMVICCCCSLFFVMGYVSDKSSDVVLSPCRIVRHYFCTYFLFDFLCGIPYQWLLYLFTKTSTNLFDPLRVLRWTRMYSMIVYLRHYTKLVHMSSFSHKITSFFVVCTYLVHWYTCAYAYIMTYNDFLNIHSSPFLTLVPSSQASHFERYTVAMHIILAHLFSTDLTIFRATEEIEQILQLLIMVSGKALLGYMLATTFEIVKSSNSSQGKYEEIVTELREYATLKKLPQDVGKRLLRFYDIKFQRRYFKEASILSQLTDSLIRDAKMHECKYLVDIVPMFRVLPPSVIEDIVYHLTPHFYLENDIFAKCNMTCDGWYVLAYGTMAIGNPAGVELFHYNDGQHFGELYLLGDGLYKNTIIAITPCKVFKLQKADFFSYLRMYPTFRDAIHEVVKSKQSMITQKLISQDAKFLERLREGEILEKLKDRRD